MNFGTSLLAVAALAGLAPAAIAQEIEVNFVNHIEAGMIEQDVYVAREAGSSRVFRVTVDDHARYLANAVYTTVAGVPHDPMDAAAIGPHEKGFDLGITLEDWLSARGSAAYNCQDGKGAISATFVGLVPNGLYTLWTFYLPMPFTEPFSTYDIPVGARDGADSVFRANPDGSANFELSFEPCLQGSSLQLASGLAAAYHSDGETYGHEPGSMGDRTHIQIFALMPDVGDMPN